MNLKELYKKLIDDDQYTCPVCSSYCEIEIYDYKTILACRKPPFLANGRKIHYCIIEQNRYDQYGKVQKVQYTYINLINGFEIFYKELYENDLFKSLFYYNEPLNICCSFEDGIDSGELEIELNFNENSPYINSIDLEKVKTAKLFK